MKKEIEIHLIKKTEVTGLGNKSYWYTEINDSMVPDSLSYDEAEAMVAFAHICRNADKLEVKKEIIETRIVS